MSQKRVRVGEYTLAGVNHRELTPAQFDELGRCPEFVLRAEVTNAHDSNAQLVVIPSMGGAVVGYLPADASQVVGVFTRVGYVFSGEVFIDTPPWKTETAYMLKLYVSHPEEYETAMLEAAATTGPLRVAKPLRAAPPKPPPVSPVLEQFIERVADIELPGEAVAVWFRYRTELFGLSTTEREDAWKRLCKRTEEVGHMKNAKVWLKKAIAEEDASRTVGN